MTAHCHDPTMKAVFLLEELAMLASKREWQIAGITIAVAVVGGLLLEHATGKAPQSLEEAVRAIESSGNVTTKYPIDYNHRMRSDGPITPSVTLNLGGSYAGPGWSQVNIIDAQADLQYAQQIFNLSPPRPSSSVRVQDPASQIYVGMAGRFYVTCWGESSTRKVLSHLR